MAKTFGFHAALLDSAGRLHQFVPGDPVPEWAAARVEGGADAGSVSRVEVKAESPKPDASVDVAGPDFTKPKQTRQRRK